MPNKCEYVAGAAVVLGITGVVVWRFVLRKSGDQKPPPNEASIAFAKTAADAVAAQKQLRMQDAGDQGQIDRHRYFFLHRRARDLGLATPALQTGAGLATLQQRIGLELDQVAAFLTDCIGTSDARGPYFGGEEKQTDEHGQPLEDPITGEARHLDLGQFVHSRTIDPPPTTEQEAVAATTPNDRQARTLRELDLRRHRTLGIVWRAAAIEASLWKGTDAAPQLQSAALAELLDRRLRALERLRYQASAGATDAGIGSSFIERVWAGFSQNNRSNHDGPWKDSWLVRPFEAPSLPRAARSDDGTWVPEEFFYGTRPRLTQRLSITGDPTGGTFALEFADHTSPDIPFDASAADVQSTLGSMSIFTSTNTTVRCRFGDLPQESVVIVLDGVIPVTLQFNVDLNNLTGGSQPKPVLDMPLGDADVDVDQGPRFDAPPVPTRRWYLNYATAEFDWNAWPGTRIAGSQWNLVQGGNADPGYGWILLPPRDTQRLTISGTPTGGKFTLKLGDETTPEIPFDASASQVQGALEQLTSGHTDFTCRGGPLPAQGVTLVFVNPSRTGQFEVDTQNLTGGTNAQVSVGPRAALQGDPPGRVIHDLFEPILSESGATTVSRADWWNRSWLHSDGLMAALHVEGLRHALLRQPLPDGTRRDDAFNSLTAQFTVALDDYFRLRSVARLENGIMDPGRNEFFENAGIAPDDLQIGDQVLFDTNPALTAAGAVAWDYPTVLVTDVDTALDRPSINFTDVKVQGFNTPELACPAFQLLLVKMADRRLKAMQDFIPFEIARLRAKSAAVNQSFDIPIGIDWDIGMINDVQRAHGESTALRLWNPYGDTWDEPGPWWLWINLANPMWADLLGTDVDRIFRRMPGAIAWQPDDGGKVRFADPSNPYRAPGAPLTVTVGPDFKTPPWQNIFTADADPDPRKVIFVPLFQPTGGWESYFDTKQNDDSPWPSALTPVRADARWVAGLATSADDEKLVRAIRPRPRIHS
jgi:hypothetical protein